MNHTTIYGTFYTLILYTLIDNIRNIFISKVSLVRLTMLALRIILDNRMGINYRTSGMEILIVGHALASV